MRIAYLAIVFIFIDLSVWTLTKAQEQDMEEI